MGLDDVISASIQKVHSRRRFMGVCKLLGIAGLAALALACGDDDSPKNPQEILLELN